MIALFVTQSSTVPYDGPIHGANARQFLVWDDLLVVGNYMSVWRLRGRFIELCPQDQMPKFAELRGAGCCKQDETGVAVTQWSVYELGIETPAGLREQVLRSLNEPTLPISALDL